MEKEVIEIGKATPEQIAMWKAQHGDVYEISVENHFGYLKKPDRKVVSYASTVGQTDPMKFNELVIQNCWIAGSDELKTRDEYFYGVAAQLSILVEVKAAEIKKL